MVDTPTVAQSWAGAAGMEVAVAVLHVDKHTSLIRPCVRVYRSTAVPDKAFG